MTAEAPDPTSYNKAAVTPEEIDLRKRWLGFGLGDEAMIAEIDKLISPKQNELIDNMYLHFLSFEETKSFFPDDDTLNRARCAQARYFARLTKGNYDAQYASEVVRTGATHHKIDLDPKWYLGAYCHVILWISSRLAEHYGQDTAKLVRALASISRLTFLDMGLVLEAYFAAKEQAIREHKDTLHELETERRVTKSIVQNAPVGIVRLDYNFDCLECNQEFMNLIGIRNREDVIGENLFELSPYLHREAFEHVRTTGQPFSASAEQMNLSPSTTPTAVYWDWAVWPVMNQDDQITGLAAKFTNATERVLLQQQREDFVATLTHDLKTPVLATNRAVKLLIEGDFGPVSDSQKEILQTIHDSNEALYKLVLTLLDVYRYDSGAKHLVLRPHDLSKTINKMVSELKALTQDKEITLSAKLESSYDDVLCDEEEIRRVLQNLLDNSLKFTAPGGSIFIYMEQSRASTTIKVVDTGKGVSEEEQAKLFQRFWQAASSGRYYASTGLGLYLCRKIIESHGGRIWCESSPGKGSTFAFTIESSVS